MRRLLIVLIVMSLCLGSVPGFAGKLTLMRQSGRFSEYVTDDGRIVGRIMQGGTLSNTPDYDWWYGCSPTSAGMMMGFYDINGYSGSTYPNIVPGGTAELSNYGNSSAIANQVIASSGHIADFYVDYGNSGNDPHPSGTHTFNSLADFMGTSRDFCGSSDGGTGFYLNPDGSRWTPQDAVNAGVTYCDGTWGIGAYVQYAGYTYQAAYLQLIYGYNWYGTIATLGITWSQFTTEIDAGRPMIIQVQGHSMLAYGYSGTNTIYIRDTWTAGTHTMTWGGSYSGMAHWGMVGLTLATTPNYYTLNVSKTGTGSGTVTSNPAGISCGSDCSENYTSGTVVTLTATSASGSTFTGWSGACSGTGTCTVTMNAAKNVTATFTLNSYPMPGVEGWDRGSLEGWTGVTAWSSVAIRNSGGNPNGYVYTTCDATYYAVGAATYDTPKYSGNYAAAGIKRVSVDLRFRSGSFGTAWLRFRYKDASYNGWEYPLTRSFPLNTWKTYTVSFDPTWTDSQALAAGWVQESFSPNFSTTMAEVYTAEIRITGYGIMEADLDNFGLYTTGADGSYILWTK